jgi:sRNA-binding regulator protein Hfq
MREKYNTPNYSRQDFDKGEARQKSAPPGETHAEKYYYKKQIDARTLMVITLTDGEELVGTIEWYDSEALKINRENAPNILLLKHNIKYMFKAAERKG